MVQETTSPKSRCEQGWFLLQDLREKPSHGSLLVSGGGRKSLAVAVSLPSLPWPWQGPLRRTTVIGFRAHPNPIWGVPSGACVKKPICQCRRHKRPGFDPWVGRIPWRRAWQPTLVLLPGNPMDRGAWQATVHRVTKSCIQLKWLSTHTPVWP